MDSPASQPGSAAEITVSAETLANFFSLLDTEQHVSTPEDVVRVLGDPAFLHSALKCMGIEVPLPHGDATTLQEYLQALTEHLEPQYASVLQDGHVSTGDPKEKRLMLGEVLIAVSIESPFASVIVNRIMSRLPYASQAEIQQAIEKFAPPPTEISSETEPILESEREPHRPPRPLVLPRLSFSKLPPRETDRSEGTPPSSTFTPTEGSVMTEQEVSRRAPTGPETRQYAADSLWKQKYDSLLAAWHESEAAREQLARSHDALKKDMDELSEKHLHLRAQTEAQVTQAQRAATSTIDTLERELTEARSRLNDITREKRDLERSVAEAEKRLQDELQMVALESEKRVKLEATVAKCKAKIDELSQYKTRNAELEAKLEEYIQKLIQAETASRDVDELRQQRDTLRGRVAALETDLSEARKAQNGEYQTKVTELQRAMDQLRQAHQKQLQTLQTEYEAALAAARPAEEPAVERLADTISMKEHLARLEHENALLRGKAGVDQDRFRELQETVETLQRARDELVAAAQTAATEEGGPTARLAMVELEKELAIRDAQLGAMRTQVSALETQVEQERQRVALMESTIRSRVEEQHRTVMGTLKDQLQIRERELTYIRLARDEQTAVQRREERLMAAAFHELGTRYVQLKAEMDKTWREHEATLLQLERQRKQSPKQEPS